MVSIGTIMAIIFLYYMYKFPKTPPSQQKNIDEKNCQKYVGKYKNYIMKTLITITTNIARLAAWLEAASNLKINCIFKNLKEIFLTALSKSCITASNFSIKSIKNDIWVLGGMCCE